MEEKLNILIVDDEEIVIDSIKLHLRKEKKYQLFSAMSVKEAIGIMKVNHINIILTDLMMPEVDGLEFLRVINEHDSSIITMMITGYATINSALQANQLGAFDYIAKPFTRDELKKAIKRAADLAYLTIENQRKGIKTVNSNSQISTKGKGIGEHSWISKDKNDVVTIGIERHFLFSIGNIATIYLPQVGDEIRQGAVYFQIFSTELRSWSLLSPLSGKVIDVNSEVIKDPNGTLSDPYGEGWLVKIMPNDYENEIKLIDK
jgi:CheY-like chemotaxis protein/glycine cleavage system H lipoate-binding protein